MSAEHQQLLSLIDLNLACCQYRQRELHLQQGEPTPMTQALDQLHEASLHDMRDKIRLLAEQ